MDRFKTALDRLAALAALLLVASFGISLTACNTVEGAGEDIEATGDAIDDAADDD